MQPPEEREHVETMDTQFLCRTLNYCVRQLTCLYNQFLSISLEIRQQRGSGKARSFSAVLSKNKRLLNKSESVLQA